MNLGKTAVLLQICQGRKKFSSAFLIMTGVDTTVRKEKTLLAPAQSSARVMPQLFIPSVHSQLLFPAMKEEEFCPSPSHSHLGISSSGMASLSKQPPSSFHGQHRDPASAAGIQGIFGGCWTGQGSAGRASGGCSDPAGAAETHGEGSKDAMVKHWAELSRRAAVFC